MTLEVGKVDEGRGGGGGGAYSFAACRSPLTIDHASPSRRSAGREGYSFHVLP